LDREGTQTDRANAWPKVLLESVATSLPTRGGLTSECPPRQEPRWPRHRKDDSIPEKPDQENPSPEPPSYLFLSRSSDETEALGKRLGASLRGGEVFALSGNLGAGKTCLARGLARGLGIHETVTSPSYVLVKSYEGRFALHHADFYRLEATLGSGPADGNAPAEMADLASLGLEDYLDDPQAVLLIEWAEHRPCWLEPPFWQVEIAGCGDGPRLLLLRQIGNRR